MRTTGGFWLSGTIPSLTLWLIKRIGVNAGKILNPTDVTRADTAHWIRTRPGVDVEKVRARFRAIDWSDLKYIETAEDHRDRGYPSLSMDAVVEDYEACKMQAVPNDPEARFIPYDDPYHTFGGGVRICGSPQTARFIANVRVPLDFDLAAHLRAMFSPENRELAPPYDGQNEADRRSAWIANLDTADAPAMAIDFPNPDCLRV